MVYIVLGKNIYRPHGVWATCKLTLFYELFFIINFWDLRIIQIDSFGWILLLLLMIIDKKISFIMCFLFLKWFFLIIKGSHAYHVINFYPSKLRLNN